MLPPAPGRLSTTTGWPVVSVSFTRHGAREDVGGAAGRERHDDADGPARIRRLREGKRRECGERRHGNCANDRANHRLPPCVAAGRRSCCGYGNPAATGPGQSTFAPDAFTMRAYLASSFAMNCENCSGVSGDGSAPSAMILSRTSGDVQDLRDVGVPLRDDGRRRAGGREEAVPRRDVEAREARFGHRRQVGHELASAVPWSRPAPSACRPSPAPSRWRGCRT